MHAVYLDMHLFTGCHFDNLEEIQSTEADPCVRLEDFGAQLKRDVSSSHDTTKITSIIARRTRARALSRSLVLCLYLEDLNSLISKPLGIDSAAVEVKCLCNYLQRRCDNLQANNSSVSRHARSRQAQKCMQSTYIESTEACAQ